MKREPRSLDSESSPKELSRLGRKRPVIVGAVVYVVLVLGLALFVSTQLYGWARLRMLNLSPLAGMEFLSPAFLQSAASQIDSSNSPDLALSDGEQANGALLTNQSDVAPINVLLLGTDARPQEDEPPRTDTMILLTLDPRNQTAGMVSLPRDLWLPIPGYDFSYKINMAYTFGEDRNYPGGGPQLAKDTVSSFVGQPVQYYVRVNFRGFTELVDLIDGIELVVPKTIHDENYPTANYGVETFHLDAGFQHLDGQSALRYARTRNVDSDYGRARRQQAIIRAVADKVLRTDMLPTLLANAPRLFYTMRSSIETDMPMALQLELANYLRDASLREIRQLVLDRNYGEETYSEDGAWILLPDRAKVRAALGQFFDGGPADGVATSHPEWVRVEILNGTDQPGVAARTKELLQSQGWQVVAIGDADRDDYGRTIIINYGIPESLVEQIGDDLELEPNLSSLHGLNITAPVDMRIVVGKDILPHIR